VAYQDYDNATGGTWGIDLQRVGRGGLAGSDWGFAYPNQHATCPRLAGENGSCVIAFLRSDEAVVGAKPSGEGGMDVLTGRLDWNGASFWWNSSLWLHSSNPDPRAVLGGLAFDRATRSHYLLTYRSTNTENLYLRVLGHRGLNLGGDTVWNAPIGETTVGGAVTYDEDNAQFLVAYGANAPAIATARIDRYRHPTAAAPTTTGIGCGSGQLSWYGSQLIGDEGCGVRMDNVPAGALMTVFVALANTNTPLLGVPIVHSGCWLLVPNTGVDSLGSLPLAVGPVASWSFALPEWLDPMSLRFQGLHFDAGNTEVFTTQRLTVPLVK
jgi:hypothetical protein